MKKKSKKVSEEKPQQLDLGIKEPFINKFFKIKSNLDLAILRFEVRKFLKDPLIWAGLVITIVLLLHQCYLIYTNYVDFPVYLPVFKYFISIPNKLVNKEFVAIFPIITIFSLILTFIFTPRFYNSEKILTKFLIFSLLLCSLAQSIILVDLTRNF